MSGPCPALRFLTFSSGLFVPFRYCAFYPVRAFWQTRSSSAIDPPHTAAPCHRLNGPAIRHPITGEREARLSLLAPQASAIFLLLTSTSAYALHAAGSCIGLWVAAASSGVFKACFQFAHVPSLPLEETEKFSCFFVGSNQAFSCQWLFGSRPPGRARSATNRSVRFKRCGLVIPTHQSGCGLCPIRQLLFALLFRNLCALMNHAFASAHGVLRRHAVAWSPPRQLSRGLLLREKRCPEFLRNVTTRCQRNARAFCSVFFTLLFISFPTL